LRTERSPLAWCRTTTRATIVGGGQAPGATGTFAVPITDFDIYWGWIGDPSNPGVYEDVLTVHTGLGDVTITGSDLVAVGPTLSPLVMGLGPDQPGQPNAINDNHWFNISDPKLIIGFTPSSSTGDPFEFDMAGVPEPSTWALMLLGVAGLGLAAYRRPRAGHAALSRGHDEERAQANGARRQV
jgi:PEP-CTERM motif